MADQLIHVVRHAHAGDRGAWLSNDDLRPLSARGCEQADRLSGRFGGDLAAVYSSPSLRCIATVLPLARAHGLPLQTRADLYEGQGASAMLEALAGEHDHPVVVCTHGDVLADLLGLLITSGLDLPATRAEKGSTWTLTLRDGVVISASYAPPP